MVKFVTFVLRYQDRQKLILKKIVFAYQPKGLKRISNNTILSSIHYAHRLHKCVFRQIFSRVKTCMTGKDAARVVVKIYFRDLLNCTFI